jgi:hypothetical protein
VRAPWKPYNIHDLVVFGPSFPLDAFQVPRNYQMALLIGYRSCLFERRHGSGEKCRLSSVKSRCPRNRCPVFIVDSPQAVENPLELRAEKRPKKKLICR